MPGGLISALGLVRLKAYAASVGRYAAVHAILVAALLAFLLLAMAFGLTALTIWLSSLFGAATAFAIVAAGALVVALAVQLAIVMHRKRRASRPSLLGEPGQTDQAALGSIAALAVLGYVLGRRTRH